jgi:hypothetical protein
MELYYVEQRRCRRCEREVQLLIEQDAARRERRVWVAKDLTDYAGKGAAA